MMKFVGAFVVASILLSFCSEQAEARYFRRAYWYHNGEEIAKQQRGNMAEYTHQQKELQESARLIRERERISAQSTVRNYGLVKSPKQLRRERKGNDTLVQNKWNNRSMRYATY